MIQVHELHAWIGITPAGHERLLCLGIILLATDQHTDAEALRRAAETVLQESKRSDFPLARIELRTFRWTP